MFGKSFKLFNLMGFEVKLDLSWIIIAILIAWSLSTGLFPFQYENLSTRTYWIMGITGAVGLFVSIIAHEFSHSFVARRHGMPMKGITLFIFGGVAEMQDEPPSPKAEFMMAAAGPFASIVIGAAFYGLYTLGKNIGFSAPITGVVGYLGFINLILAAFNLVPAFPLDGGRILRAGLWAARKNLNWATRIASRIGTGFALILIFLGILNVLTGNFIGGMWWFLIGMFLHGASRMSYQKLLTKRALQGEPIRRFMKTDAVTVSPSATIDDLVEQYVYKYHHKLFPVVDETGRLTGCITTRDLKDIPRSEWPDKTVMDVADDCSPVNTIRPDQDATEALAVMHKNGSGRLMVTDDGKLVGIVTLKDMLDFLSLKIELEENA